MFVRFGSRVTAERTTIENWRKQVVAAQVRQDPSAIESEAKFDVDDNSFIYVRVRAVSAGEYHGPNGNGDYFPESELKNAFKTFVRRGVYLDHQSDNVDKAIGIILDAKYHDDPGTKYVELLLAIDKSMPIADKIAKGYANDVSMGAIVERCECSICHKTATNMDEYCDHLKTSMGREIGGRKVFAVNYGVNFYEISYVTVGADKEAKTLEILASIKQDSPMFARLLKLADDFEAAKAAGGADISGYGADKSAAPQPPQLKKEPKDESLGAVVKDVVHKEVEKGVEHALIQRVRDAITKLKPQQMVSREVPDEELASLVRDELAKRTGPVVAPAIQSALHEAVAAQIEQLDKAASPPPPFDIGDGYNVREVTKVAGEMVVQLFRAGEPMGLFCRAYRYPEDGSHTHQRDQHYYRDQFSIKSAQNIESEPDWQKFKKDDPVNGLLTIRYVPAEKLEDCVFVARRGNLQAAQSAVNLLNEDTQRAIIASEAKTAAGKVEMGVGEYDMTKGKVDVKIEVGKEPTQPSVLTKNLGGVEKGSTSDVDITNGKVDGNNFKQDKEPIQPSQVVSKYASMLGGKVVKLAQNKATGAIEATIEGGSLARLAQLWRVRPSLVKANVAIASEKRTSKLSNVPQLSREMTEPVQADPKNHKDMIARETPAGPGDAKPSGSLGGEQIKYYTGMGKGTLSDAGDGSWARKVASLNAKLAEAETEKRILKATLEKVQKQQEGEKRGTLVEAIMASMESTGALDPDQGEILELKEKGLDHEDAVAKATANLCDRQRRDLSALTIEALEKMKTMLNRVATNTRTVEPETLKHVDVPITGNDDQSGGSTLEDKLASGW